MAIASDRIESIIALASRRFAAGDRLTAIVHAVKEANPGLSVTGTFESVMAEEPFREAGRFNLYLVDGSNHCWAITDTADAATGVVIAERDEDA